MARGILVLNAGSSSIKFAIYGWSDNELGLHYRGNASGLGTQPQLAVYSASGEVAVQTELDARASHKEALAALLDWIEAHLGDIELTAAGHRVVHGGCDHRRPAMIDEGVLAELEALCPLAPLHQPHNLAAIRAVARLRPNLPQVACFDTAFHRTQPEVAQRFALPEAYAEKGVLRYGFHGLSYEYIAYALPAYDSEAAQGRVIVAHLGNGASMCAMEGGRSIATTMGFTALDGLPMGQRCGDLDPGVVLYLLQSEGLSVAEVEDLLYRRSGLYGVSGISSDMRDLLASEEASAERAIDLYCYRARREIGSLTAALGGLDALVFTGGIGENAVAVRERICGDLRWLGLELAADANRAQGPAITTAESRVRGWVIPTNEELMIARHTAALLA